jgi:hypothetical protein
MLNDVLIVKSQHLKTPARAGVFSLQLIANLAFFSLGLGPDTSLTQPLKARRFRLPGLFLLSQDEFK